MKFMLFLMPGIPTTREERAALRPIGQRTDKFQQMIEQVGELARIAEDLGFDTVATAEHHLHEEGLEMGGTAAFHYHIAMQTKHIRVGPIGYVLPAWNPLRLAIETAWLDQLTKGRAIVGMARGYQTRWFNNMSQKYSLTAPLADLAPGAKPGVANSEADDLNRMAFEEVYDILELAWKDEPFSYKGRFWEYPFPHDEGTPWPAHDWTEKYGTPGVVVDGRLKKLNVVPKPYQKPHPQTFTAFSTSDATIKWAAKKGVVPTITTTTPQALKRTAELYRDEAAAAGRRMELGQNIAATRLMCIGDTREQAMQYANATQGQVYYREFAGGFGFWEGFRLPGDEEKYPRGKVKLPESEWTLDRLEQCGYLVAGTPDDIRHAIDDLVEAANPEFLQVTCGQGFIPFEDQVRQLRYYGEKIMPHFL